MKKVLIITYYWPPSGGSGVQRWLKMSKYLPENGWQPVIYTAENAEYPVEDYSLERDICSEAIVLKRPIFEPYNVYKRFLGIKKENKIKAGFLSEETKPSVKENISRWIRGNFFIPDARCWWIRPSVKYLSSYLKENHVDAIISTGPPHSMHLIAKELHRITTIPWIADFRDPWTEIDFYQDLKLTKWADRKHHRLEKKVLTEADRVVSVGWDMATAFEKVKGSSVDVIPNGYDDELDGSSTSINLSDKFTITHIGIITPSRNIETFWKALSELTESNKEFADNLEIKLVGTIDNSVKSSLEKFNILQYSNIISNMPHDAVIQEQCSSHVLLLLINRSLNAKSILTGKLFEYLYANRPILGIGPEDGDAAKVINDCQAGIVIDYENIEKMKTEILRLFSAFNGKRSGTADNLLIHRYSRRNLAKNYVSILDKLISR